MQRSTWIAIFTLLTLAVPVAWLVFQRLADTAQDSVQQRGLVQPVPVEVAAVEQGRIERQRFFSGTLQAHTEIVLSPKISGRIELLDADLGDTVSRGQVVARLDSDEYVQSVKQAEAELAVARANLAEADSLLKIAERELERIANLRQRGVSSESELDAARADQLARQAHVTVTSAQVTQAQAALESARIRLSYTQVTANWRGGSDQRVVAERFADEGETVGANTPLLRIAELDPIRVVIFVVERDYALLQQGQHASLTTDAYPGDAFFGRITRIAPVFRESTRQARVELRVDNPHLKLKPGMFVRVLVTLEQADSATIIPEQSLAVRAEQRGVFLVNSEDDAVIWRPVTPGIQQGGRIQVVNETFTGRVVVLGQQLLDDGSAITVAGERPVTGQ